MTLHKRFVSQSRRCSNLRLSLLNSTTFPILPALPETLKSKQGRSRLIYWVRAYCGLLEFAGTERLAQWCFQGRHSTGIPYLGCAFLLITWFHLPSINRSWDHVPPCFTEENKRKLREMTVVPPDLVATKRWKRLEHKSRSAHLPD